ncbi:hydrolase [Cyclobacterium sp. 1_MG-2023]|uniref:BT0820 family HAD-type phosphatase n=1 Tax=Cyclobacterium sp. 1_MG-2023 TaxID=3062681 RepID=UPI0026E2C4A2|nr:hydrolase [Cyclobacterium sp. 1_MG-2023]MDO6439793.1 hydrolase [Cyclobacterium sp. 1_MG-2023]
MIHPLGKTIAIDFDGTIVEHAYPKIGKTMLFAFETIKELEKKGHRLILWTYREGPLLKEAADFCKDNGIEFYAVNENYPGESDECQSPRKLEADIFIDDRNIGGFLGWEIVWQTLHPEGGEFHHQLRNSKAHFNYRSKRKKWFKFFSWF